MEDLKQTPPASIESDAASEYMRGYSDGLAQAEETIAAAIQRAKAEEREACANAIERMPAGLFSCDACGSPATAYVAQWKATDEIRGRP